MNLLMDMLISWSWMAWLVFNPSSETWQICARAHTHTHTHTDLHSYGLKNTDWWLHMNTPYHCHNASAPINSNWHKRSYERSKAYSVIHTCGLKVREAASSDEMACLRPLTGWSFCQRNANKLPCLLTLLRLMYGCAETKRLLWGEKVELKKKVHSFKASCINDDHKTTALGGNKNSWQRENTRKDPGGEWFPWCVIIWDHFDVSFLAIWVRLVSALKEKKGWNMGKGRNENCLIDTQNRERL